MNINGWISSAVALCGWKLSSVLLFVALAGDVWADVKRREQICSMLQTLSSQKAVEQQFYNPCDSV